MARAETAKRTFESCRGHTAGGTHPSGLDIVESALMSRPGRGKATRGATRASVDLAKKSKKGRAPDAYVTRTALPLIETTGVGGNSRKLQTAMSELPNNDSGAPSTVPDVHVRSVRHGFSLRSASALSFATMRPLYVFSALALFAAAGTGWWLALLICFAISFVIALVFGELASRWPLEGSVYEWTRQLYGARAALLVGWAYLCSYVVFMAALAFRVAFTVLTHFNANPNHLAIALVSAALLVLATVLNLAGRTYLKLLAVASAAVSLVICLVYGTLLLGHSTQPISSLFSHGADGLQGSAWISGPFLIAMLYVSAFAIRGMEMTAEVAEEVRDPERNVPKAMVWSLAAAALVIIYTGAALALATPTPAAGESPASGIDVVSATLGEGAAKLLGYAIIFAFFVALMIFQMAASRTLWITTRDRVLPAHTFFGLLTPGERLPARAIISVGIVAVILPFITSTAASYVLFGTAAAALMLAFLVPVLGILRARSAGKWIAGPWSLGSLGLPAAVVSALALIALTVNVLWPRAEVYSSGIASYGAVVGVLVILISGLFISRWAFREGGIYTRHNGHVERDLDRIRMTHSGTCALCLRPIAAGKEAQWHEESHLVVCVPCDEMSAWLEDNPNSSDSDLAAVFVDAHETHASVALPSESTLRRLRDHAVR